MPRVGACRVPRQARPPRPGSSRAIAEASSACLGENAKPRASLANPDPSSSCDTEDGALRSVDSKARQSYPAAQRSSHDARPADCKCRWPSRMARPWSLRYMTSGPPPFRRDSRLMHSITRVHANFVVQANNAWVLLGKHRGRGMLQEGAGTPISANPRHII